MKKRIFGSLWVCLLTIYAPLELSRYIIANEFVQQLHPEIPIWQSLFELFVMWGFYSMGMGLILGMATYLKKDLPA